MEEETIIEKNESEVEIGDTVNEKDEEMKKKKQPNKQSKDLEFLSCMMQPATAESDPQYVGIRRILLHRKAESGAISRRYVRALHLSSFSHQTSRNHIAWSQLTLAIRSSDFFFFCLSLKDWRCNGKGYVAYRNFISKPRKWENLRTPSLLSSPGNRFCEFTFRFFFCRL